MQRRWWKTSTKPWRPDRRSPVYGKEGAELRSINFRMSEDLSEDEQRQLPSYERFLPQRAEDAAIMVQGETPRPSPPPQHVNVDSQKYYDDILQRLREPSQYRAHRLVGRVSVDGRNSLVRVDRQVFAPSMSGIHRYKRGSDDSYLNGLIPSISPRRRVKSVLYLRHQHEFNYYHFICEIAPRVAFANELGLPEDMPVLVAARLAEKPFYKAVADDLLRGREVIVQRRRETIVTDEMYFLQVALDVRLHIDPFISGVPSEDPGLGSPERVLLRRETDVIGNRRLSNFNKLEARLAQAGYFSIDPAVLSVPQQKHLFENARSVITEYGAGLTNLVFGRPGLRIDALTLSRRYTTTFPPLAEAFGVDLHVHTIASEQEGSWLTGELSDSLIDKLATISH